MATSLVRGVVVITGSRLAPGAATGPAVFSKPSAPAMEADMSLDTVRCIVTGHDAQGRAVVTDDTRLETRMNPSKVSAAAVVWTTSGAPVDLTTAEHGRERAAALTLAGGSVLRIIDMMPGGCSPMHRTSSLDYGIVLSGQVELILDEGAITTVAAGEVVIQRGTIHAWRNSTDKMARIAFVLLDAIPATVGGEPLPDVHVAAGVKPDFR